MHSKYKITCLFCHYKAETNSYANFPTTKDCMMCHIALRTESELLKSVIFSYDSLVPLSFKKTHNLPDYVRFNHSLHINQGIDCATCHGLVEEMDSTFQVRNFTMGWCVECHRQPEKYVIQPREISGIFYAPNESFKLESNPLDSISSKQIITIRRIQPASTECSTCHN
ncbi:MAG: cytochrome c family protein [Ignavibacteria bacterium]|nr:cytochrome c family protein [Ignavibacteria bacterium]